MNLAYLKWEVANQIRRNNKINYYRNVMIFTNNQLVAIRLFRLKMAYTNLIVIYLAQNNKFIGDFGITDDESCSVNLMKLKMGE